jgi:hypothetical protein
MDCIYRIYLTHVLDNTKPAKRTNEFREGEVGCDYKRYFTKSGASLL